MIDASEVSTALGQLYNPLSSPRTRRRADSLLQRYQRTPEAAQNALRVLQTPITDGNSAQVKAERAFAATTLYTTVASYVRTYKLENPAAWTDAERAHHKALARQFEIVCQEVWNVLTGPHGAAEDYGVQTQLALTIAVILLRFHDQHDANSSLVGAVEWLVTNQTAPPVAHDLSTSLTNFAILLTLKVIPEEVENKRVKFSKTRRAQCEALVQQSAPFVVTTILPTLAAAIDADATLVRLRAMVLDCFASWVEFGRVAPSIIIASGLLDRAFAEAIDKTYSETALRCIREVVQSCAHDANANIPLMEVVMQRFVALGAHVQTTRAAVDRACLEGCATAIAECGQAFIVTFVDQTLALAPGSLVDAFLETVLAFTALPDIAASNATMDFWIDFRQYVSGKHEQRMLAFEAFVSRLLRILVERTEFPVAYESFGDVDKERFTAYRNDVRGVFRSLATVTQASEDAFVIDAIHVVMHQFAQLDANEEALRTHWWKRIEVYVHALSAVSKSIREDDLSLIPHLFALLARPVPRHAALARTTTIFLGVMGHWFARNPTFLHSYALAILSQSFAVDASTSDPTYPFRMRLHGEDHVGAVALKKLTQRCGRAFYTPTWLDAMLSLYRASRRSTHAPSSTLLRLRDNSIQLVVESLAHVVATVAYSDAVAVIDQFGALAFQDLVTQWPTFHADDDACVALVCEVLEHLHVIATIVEPQVQQNVSHPLLHVLQVHWATIDAIVQLSGDHDDVATSVCRLFVAVFAHLRSQALALATALTPLVVTQFARSLNGNYLSVVQAIVLACARDDPETHASLTRVVVVVTDVALTHIATVQSVDDCAALIAAVFELARSCGTHRPQLLVATNQLEALLALVQHALTHAQSPDVCVAALEFLTAVGGWYGEVLRLPSELLCTGALDGAVALFTQIQTLFFAQDVQYQLMVALFNAAGGSMPPALLERVAEVVRSCWACFGKQRSEELITRLLLDDAFVGSHVAARARSEFVGTIAKPECFENARKFKRVLSAFCDHFRKTLATTSAAAAVAPPTSATTTVLS